LTFFFQFDKNFVSEVKFLFKGRCSMPKSILAERIANESEKIAQFIRREGLLYLEGLDIQELSGILHDIKDVSDRTKSALSNRTL
jgi:hypothetical protein